LNKNLKKHVNVNYVQTKAPLKADEVLVFKTLIVTASAIVLLELMYCLSWFFCAHVYGFTVDRICSLAIAGQHPTSAWAVLSIDVKTFKNIKTLKK